MMLLDALELLLLKLVFPSIFLTVASVQDLKTHLVSDWVWLLLGACGVAGLLFSSVNLVQLAVSLVTAFVAIVICVWRKVFSWSSADVLCLLCLALVYPEFYGGILAVSGLLLLLHIGYKVMDFDAPLEKMLKQELPLIPYFQIACLLCIIFLYGYGLE